MGSTEAPKKMNYGAAVTVLLIGTACLAFSGVWVKAANFEPATSVILRCWLPLILFVPVVIWEGRKRGWLSKSGIMWAIVAGLILGIDFTAWNYAIFYVGAGVASVLLNLQVIILPVLAWLIDKEKIPTSYWFLLPIMAIGIAAVGGVFNPADPNAAGPEEIYGVPTAILGTLLGCLPGVCYGTYLYTSRRSSQVSKPGQHVQPIAIVLLFQGVAPTVFLAINAIIPQEGKPVGEWNLTQGVLANGELPADPTTMYGDDITAFNWLMMIMLAVLGQLIAWWFVQIGSVNMDATLSAGLLLLSPVSTIFIAAFLFGEIPTWIQIVGVVMVLGAVAYQNGLFEVFVGKRPRDQKDVHGLDEVFDEEQISPLSK